MPTASLCATLISFCFSLVVGPRVGWTSSYSASALSSLFPAVCTWYRIHTHSPLPPRFCLASLIFSASSSKVILCWIGGLTSVD